MKTPPVSSSPSPLSRRRFLGSGLVLAGGTLCRPHAWAAEARPTPSNRIHLGVIGCGNQGMNDIMGFNRDKRVQIVAVCDVNRRSRGYWANAEAGRDYAKWWLDDEYKKAIRAGTFNGVDTYGDYREMLQRKDIDAVLIATPDHWHCLHVVDAARAGKHIYGQKPLSLTVDEGRVMSDVVRKAGVVFQTGSQQRSSPYFRYAANLARNGYLGKIHTVRAGLPGGRPDYSRTGLFKAPAPVPEGFDYETWLGPAPRATYAPARCHILFRWIYDYSGGQVTDWGAHHIDCGQWGLGTDLTGPTTIRKIRGVFPPDPLWNTATEFSFECVYPDGVVMVVSDKERFGTTFEGENGWIHADRRANDASAPELLSVEFSDRDRLVYHSEDHYRNFIDCVIRGGATAAPIEVAHRSVTICHLANIGMRLGRSAIQWDPTREHIIGDPGAADLLKQPYRGPWAYPEA